MGNANNWDQLVRLIVPLSFLAIWAVTSLFNRESKPVGRPSGPLGPGPRSGDPTMRWGAPNPEPNNASTRRGSANGGDDDILVIRSSPPLRPGQARPNPVGPGTLGARRGSKAKAAAPSPARAESVSTRPKLAGVTQNVNQQLTRSMLDLSPLITSSPSATSTTVGLSTALSAPSKSTYVAPSIVLAMSLRDPSRLREAFLVNELLQPPVALRPRGGRRI